jgi:hypothetical protein
MKNGLGSLMIAASLVGGAAGCVVRGHAGFVAPAPVAVVEVEEEPPPPRAVVVETRPGYIFIEGRYERRGRQWVWMDGRWERERSGYYYEQGRWENRGRGHVWVDGGWRGGGGGGGHGTVVRDHRSPPPAAQPAAPPPGPVVRDHRH